MCNLEIKKMTSFKYLAAYTIPMATALALYFKGPFSFAALIYAFGIIPLLEIVLKEDARNDPKEIVVLKKVRKIYDYLLYVNLPIVYALVVWTALEFYHGALSAFETCGLVLSLGVSLGTNGINVAHELGHRKNNVEKTLAKALLLPSFYMHFFIEHNWGHHTYAATKEDPATAQYQQSVYGFWISSVSRQYANAWKIQGKRNRENGWGFWSIYNDMMWYTILQLVYLVTIWFVFNINTALLMLAAGVVGFILLETVNYIEHYGLLRSKMTRDAMKRFAPFTLGIPTILLVELSCMNLPATAITTIWPLKNTKAWCVGKRRRKCPLVTLPQWSFPCFRLFGLN
jgi:alkane 1-monooxygenase